MERVKASATLMQNMSWLLDKGFIVFGKERWMNIYLTMENRIINGELYSSAEKAKEHISIINDKHITTVKLN